MKTSARNQFAGKVTNVSRGAVNDEVELQIAGGERIVAVITHGSAEELGLTTGVDAIALIKASSIIIVADDEGALFSARNRLVGSVSAIHPGAVNTEVVIALPNAGSVASIITNDSASSLGLKVGSKASAIFKASSVIIAVPR